MNNVNLAILIMKVEFAENGKKSLFYILRFCQLDHKQICKCNFFQIMKPLTLEKITELQKHPANIRNICILAHVDHGRLIIISSIIMLVLCNLNHQTLAFITLTLHCVRLNLLQNLRLIWKYFTFAHIMM